MKKITIIIVNYNTKDLLIKCIQNLLDIYPNKEIIAVDNGSTDGSPDGVKSNFNSNQIIFIESENKGLSAGYNLGLSKASGDYILYLGTDAFPDQKTISGIVNYFDDQENKNVGIATTKLITRDGKADMDAHRGFQTPWSTITHLAFLDRIFPKSRLFNQYFMGYQDFSKPHEIDACISHFMFVRKEVHEKIGNWDEDYFLYGEDLDFCYRAKEAGFKVMYLPQWETLHYKGASVGRKTVKDLDDGSTKNATVKHVLSKERTHAMKLFVQKHLIDKYPKPLICLIYLGIFLLQLQRTIEAELTFRLQK